MIDALVAGKLFKAAEERRSNAGKTYVTASVRAADSEGESLFVKVIAFSDTAKAALLALDDGDSVSLAGSLKVGTYEARDGSVRPSVSMVAAQVLTAYAVQRKRKAVADVGEKKQPALAGEMDDGLDDL